MLTDKATVTDKEIQSLEGYLHPQEFRTLEGLASSFSPHTSIEVVEIGAFMGKSTVAIGTGLSRRGDGSRVYSIDWHQGSPEHRQHESFTGTLEEFRHNVERFGVDSVVQEVVGKSKDVVDSVPDGVDILWIDAQHEYEAVKLDFDLYEGKVKPDGLVLFHDAYRSFWWYGPIRLIREDILLRRSDYDLFLISRGIIGLRKRRKTTSTFDIDTLGFVNYEQHRRSRIFWFTDKALNLYMRYKYRPRA